MINLLAELFLNINFPTHQLLIKFGNFVKYLMIIQGIVRKRKLKTGYNATQEILSLIHTQ